MYFVSVSVFVFVVEWFVVVGVFGLVEERKKEQV